MSYINKTSPKIAIYGGIKNSSQTRRTYEKAKRKTFGPRTIKFA